ncbi:hypothetical protein PV326_008040, partial [Microctonus aethiopoides]
PEGPLKLALIDYLDVQDLLAVLAAIGFRVSPKNTRSQNLLNVKVHLHVFDILEVLEDEEINDDLPSLQPINIGIKPDDEILDSFSTETESQLGPSKKLRLNRSFF